MKTPNVPISPTGKLLLVGDISKAFFDAGTVAGELCEVYSNIPDAINAAAKRDVTAIGVVMAGQADGLDRIKPAFGGSAKLSSLLSALREANSNAKIILLAQMYEEPIAGQFISEASNGTSFADDYLICPLHFSYLVSRISYLASPQDAYRRSIEYIRQLERLATTDDLTGLKNRRYIWEFCRQILEHAEKEKGRVTLLIFDIDNFKHYNDVYGHSVGDKILKQAAILMQRCCRSHDVVARIGGDEFAVVFFDLALGPQQRGLLQAERRSATSDHPKEAVSIAKRIRDELEKAELGPHFAKEGKMGTHLHLLGPKGAGVLTISGGLASFPHDGSQVQELFAKADKALLQAKRSGKNRIYLVGKQFKD